MDSSDKLIARVYNFLDLSQPDKNTVIDELTQSFKENNTLKWPAHRRLYVIELCKELANAPMTTLEMSRLQNVRQCFESISSIEELDTCLMFWQITKDLRYWNHIHAITIDPYHPLFAPASLIIGNK